MNLEQLKFPIGQFEKPNEISNEILSQWIKVIEEFPQKIKTITNSLSVEELNWNYRPNGWNIKQVVHHCADSHINSFIRFKLALTEDNPTIKPYDEALWANLIDGNDNNISSSLKIIEGIHTKWTMLLNSFQEEELNKTFHHPESNKKYILKEVIGLYAWHCNHHFAHIEQAIRLKNNFNYE
ncbi:MAG: YfiT family bacillithiol transferase [Flavobacterium sp.]|jgi:hypothetical protein